MTPGISRWEVLESAAARMEFAASRATPGPWWRPTRLASKNGVLADMPQEETEMAPKAPARPVVVAMAQAMAPTNRFLRKRSGRDLEYIALVHPLVGKGIADMLRTVALEMKEANEQAKPQGWREPDSWGACLRLAHRILRSGEQKKYGE